MSAQSMLEQLLKQGLGMTRQPGFGSGAAAGGLLGLLLGTRRGRSLGGSALKYGGLAALGALAYKAYNDWQAQQAQQGQPGATGAAAPPPAAALPAPAPEAHSRALLVAMVAAAKADGHLDEQERGLIEAELQRQQAEPADRAWFEAELKRPLDPAEVARAASTPEVAAEMYLASLLVADETSFMERAYLDELARQLALPADLKARLEAQAQTAG